MKTEIILVRHSEPDKNKMVENELIPLSENGKEKIEALSKTEIFKNVKIVISSHYKRAIETGEVIAKQNNCELKVDKNLGERKLGTEKKDENFWITQLQDENAKTKDGESQKEVRIRMLKVIDDVLNKYNNEKIVLVSHGASITFLLMNWCKLEECYLENKRKKLSFKGKIVINDTFKTPEIFKLTFIDKTLENIERVTT